MNASISVKVNAAGHPLQEAVVLEGAGRAGRTLRLKVPPKARVEMVDMLTGLGPEQIQVKRVDKALHVAFKGADLKAPDLVLEDFFKGKDEDHSRLLGKTSGNDSQDYGPQDSSAGQVGEMADGGLARTYVLHDSTYAAAAEGAGAAKGAAAGGGMSTLGMLGVAAGVVLVAGVAAGGGGGGDGGPASPADSLAPTAPSDVAVVVQADGRVLVTGLAEASSTVIVRFPDGSEKAVAAQADGAFSAVSDAAQSSGTVSAQARDAAGNTGPVTEAQYTDTTAPAAPALAFQPHADGSATASGTAEAGARVEVSFPNQTLVAVQADASGNFSVTSAGAAGNGNGSAVAIDAAGNASARTTVALRDDLPPSATATIGDVRDDFAPLTGALASGSVTNDRTPLLEGNLSAALEPGSVLAVLRNGQQVGQAQVAGTRWSFQDTVRADGALSYSVQAVDAAGNRGPLSTAFALTIDSTPPGAPTVDQAISNVGGATPVQNAGSTADTTPTLQGSLPAPLAAGQVLVILRNGVVVKTFEQSGRTWSFEDQTLADGTYTYQAEVREAATGEVSRSNTFTLGIDHTPPRAAPTIQSLNDDVPLAVGSLASGATTNDTAPVLSGVLSAPLAAGEQVLVYRDGAPNPLIATVSGTTWTVQDGGLQSGQTYAYHANVVDAAGNAGASSAVFRFSVDKAAPNQSSGIDRAESNVAGSNPGAASGGALGTTAPTFTGHLSAPLGAGETLTVLRDGTAIGPAITRGNVVEFSDQGLQNGSTYRYTLRVVDAAGNQGPASAPFVLAIDTSAPQQAVRVVGALDDVGATTGTVATGGRTDDLRPTLQGSLSAPLGATDTLQILRDGVVIVSATRPAGLDWTYTEAQNLAPGVHTYSARVSDAAGHVGPPSEAFTLTVGPDPVSARASIKTVSDDVQPQTGTVASGGATNDTSPQIAGTLSQALGEGQVVYVFREGLSQGLQARVDGLQWWVDDSGLVDGKTYHYVAQVAAAGASVPVPDLANGYQISVDTQAPDQASRMGYEILKDQTTQLSGNLDGALGAGEAVVIYRQDGRGAEVEIGRIQALSAEFSWTYHDQTPFTEVTSYIVRVVDAAGNRGEAASSFYAFDPQAMLEPAGDLALVHGDTYWALPVASAPAPAAGLAEYAAGAYPGSDLLHPSGMNDFVL